MRSVLEPELRASRRTLLRGIVGTATGATLFRTPLTARAAGPQIAFDPPTAPLDAPVQVRISGLNAHEPVTLRAAMYDGVPQEWASAATYTPAPDGTLDLATAVPRSGDYRDADPMGLFWSMRSHREPDDPLATGFSYTSAGPRTLPMTLTAIADGQILASATLERRIFADDVQRVTVQGQPFVGTLFRPSGPGPFGGVIVLGGSEGGQPGQRAGLLAAHGFLALSVAYFGANGVPSQLGNVPLEYFAPAIRWLQAQEGVRADRIGVMGTSRGGELALLLGATYPEIRAVVGYVPSGVVWVGFGQAGMVAPPAWTYGGMPVPFVRSQFPADVAQMLGDAYRESQRTGKPYVNTPYFRAALIYAMVRSGAEIPVERINGPVLLLSGEADALWPSTELSEIAVQRLADNRFAHPVTHLHYPDTGHFIGTPYLPTTVTHAYNPSAQTVLAGGGTAAGYAAANADSWPKVLAFLDDALNH